MPSLATPYAFRAFIAPLRTNSKRSPCVSAVERQLEHTLVVDHLTDARASRFDQGSIRFDLDLLGHLANLQRDRDDGIRADLQHDSCLHKAPESRKACLEHVGSDRQVG